VPIYEYRCDKCRRVFSFLVRNVAAHTTPACPRCRSEGIVRVFSPFAVHGGGRPASGGADDAGEGTTAGEDLPPELEGLADIDESDPRSMGRWIRRMAEQEPLDAQMEDVCARLEAGEDPERIDEELGGDLGEDFGGYQHDDTLYEA